MRLREKDRDRESERMEGKRKEDDTAVSIDHRGSATPTPQNKGTFTKLLDYLKYNGNWLEETRGCSTTNACAAGTLLLAYKFQATYLGFIICNTIAFTSSLSVTFLLLSGFPFKNVFCMGLLAFSMCTTLTFLGVTYVLAFAMLIPGTLYFKLFWIVIFIPIGVLLFLIVVVVLIHAVRFLYWLAKKIASEKVPT